MNLFKYSVLLCVCFRSLCYPQWDPRVLSEKTSPSFDILQEPTYLKLKKKLATDLMHGWCSVEKIHLLADLTVLIRPKVCVEIGSFAGSSVLPVAATLKYVHSGKIFAVDAWSNTEAAKLLAEDDPNRSWWALVDMQKVHAGFKRLMNRWGVQKFCKEISKPSDLAIWDVPEEIDFLHLDGDYSEEGAIRDVALYLPKVKTGGYILLSNLYVMVGRVQPKIKAFCMLCESCEIITSIENNNAVLFRKT